MCTKADVVRPKILTGRLKIDFDHLPLKPSKAKLESYDGGANFVLDFPIFIYERFSGHLGFILEKWENF